VTVAYTTSRGVTESVKAVAEYLGHADPGFTLRVYTHLFPSSAARARKAVDGLFLVAPKQAQSEQSGARS
jgi:integrase